MEQLIILGAAEGTFLVSQRALYGAIALTLGGAFLHGCIYKRYLDLGQLPTMEIQQ